MPCASVSEKPTRVRALNLNGGFATARCYPRRRVEPARPFCCTWGVVRIVAIIAALLAVAGAQASQPAARPLVGLKAPEGPLLGMVWIGRDAEIIPLDATTLEPAGAALPIKESGAFGYSPDRSNLALGTVNPPRVRFIDVAPLEVVRSVELGRIGGVERIDWLGAGAAGVLFSAPPGPRAPRGDPTNREGSQ